MILMNKLCKYFKDIGQTHFTFNYRHCPYTWILENLHHSDSNGYYYCCRKAINRPLEYCEVCEAAYKLGLKHSYNLLYRNIAHPDFDPSYKEIKPILDLWVANNNNVMRFPIVTCDAEYYLLKRYADEQK